MSKATRVITVVALACAVVAVLALKSRTPEADATAKPAGEPASAAVTNAALPSGSNDVAVGLPRLVDLGAGKCIPCKMMAPILEELKKDFAGTFDVEFIDVWQDPEAGEPYGIRTIPTQIFYDKAGKELFRHEGFFGKDDILAKWKEYGVASAAGPGE